MKCNFYIDGYNFYHRFKAYEKSTGTCYKWFNYKTFCENYIGINDELGTIYFFTAMSHKKESQQRHKDYILALKSLGIEVIEGFFMPLKKIYNNALVKSTGQFLNGVEITTHEEKKTDTNLVGYMIKDAFLDNFDKAFILSGDNDVIPALQIIKQEDSLKHKQLIVIPPPYVAGHQWKDRHKPDIFAKHSTKSFQPYIDGEMKNQFPYLQNHLLPEKILDANGNLIVEIPQKYLKK